MKRHLIIASNRGPVSFSTDESGAVSASSGSFGGLKQVAGDGQVTFISIAATPADRAIAEQAGEEPITRGAPAGVGVRFITPSRRAFHRYYNVICNPLLWFLHHRSWGFTHTPNIDREAHTAWEQGMVAVSRMFADEVAAQAARMDAEPTVLLRDYHMHVVGGLVRERLSDVEITCAPGVPWPGPADWTMLPSAWRTRIFESMLACDTVALTSERDRRSFLAGVREFVPGAEIHDDGRRVVGSSGREVRINVVPPSIDDAAVMTAADSHRTRTVEQRLREDDRYTFVTAERAEPHRNIVRCIRAYGSLLDEDKALADETRYLLVLAPPPPHLSQYRRYVEDIRRAAKEVNGRRRSGAGRPVELVIESNYPMALAAMRIADTLVSAPLADAACASQLSTPLINRSNCTLIVSETSSAAEMFGDAAAQVSPADVEAMKGEMLRSFEMPEEERESQFARLESVALDAAESGKAFDLDRVEST